MVNGFKATIHLTMRGEGGSAATQAFEVQGPVKDGRRDNVAEAVASAISATLKLIDGQDERTKEIESLKAELAKRDKRLTDADSEIDRLKGKAEPVELPAPKVTVKPKKSSK